MNNNKKGYLSLHLVKKYLRLPIKAKIEHFKDYFGISKHDPGIDNAIDASIAWLCRAQDNSKSNDGGVAHNYSLIDGWSTSYPETTGYIIPTMLEYAKLKKDENIRVRAKKMLDWLVSIQFQEGGFQGGRISSEPKIPVTFNTGQILLGLAAGVKEFGNDYRQAMYRAADWLVETQDDDGCWRMAPTPLAAPGEKAYETHVAWGLFEAARIDPSKKYKDAALDNIMWAISLQQENGWFKNCGLSDSSQPLTHAIGYVLRGILEAYKFTKEPKLLNACKKTADSLLTALQEDGFLPGRFFSNWKGSVNWVCLTGSVQIAYCWLKMYQYTGITEYRDAAYAVNKYVRRTMKKKGAEEIRGAIKGSFPVYGGYQTYQYPNWACKFFIDSNMLEKEVRQSESAEVY